MDLPIKKVIILTCDVFFLSNIYTGWRRCLPIIVTFILILVRAVGLVIFVLTSATEYKKIVFFIVCYSLYHVKYIIQYSNCVFAIQTFLIVVLASTGLIDTKLLSRYMK